MTIHSDKSTGKSRALTIEEYDGQMKKYFDRASKYDEHTSEIENSITPLSFDFNTKEEAVNFVQFLRARMKNEKMRDSYISQRKKSVLVLPKDVADGTVGMI